MMSIGSLFSGIGGLELGLERAGVGRVAWQAESDPYCAAVLARHWPGAEPANGAAHPMSGGSGRSSPASSSSSALQSWSLRTCSGCERSDCEACWPILPLSGSMRNGRVSAQPTAELRTSGGASSSLLPTPSASAYGSNRGGSAGRVGIERLSLASMARAGMLPTPTARDVKGPGSGTDLPRALGASRPTAMLPTPTVRGNHNRRGLSPQSGDGLATAVGGSLHPRFVEWMMGFPIDWTQAPMTQEQIKAKRTIEGKRRGKRQTRGASEPSAMPSSSNAPRSSDVR